MKLLKELLLLLIIALFFVMSGGVTIDAADARAVKRHRVIHPTGIVFPGYRFETLPQQGGGTITKFRPVTQVVDDSAAAAVDEADTNTRKWKLAALRSKIRDQADRASRRDKRVLLKVLSDPDRMAVVQAQVEWLESQQAVGDVSTAEDEQGPVLRFLQFIIDNWDQIKQIIEFVSDLFGTPEAVTISPAGDSAAVLSFRWAAHRRIEPIHLLLVG